MTSLMDLLKSKEKWFSLKKSKYHQEEDAPNEYDTFSCQSDGMITHDETSSCHTSMKSYPKDAAP
jgi:hypothetical protein